MSWKRVRQWMGGLAVVRPVVLCIVVILVTAGGILAHAAPDRQERQVLLVYPGAEDVRFSSNGPRLEMNYTVKVPYPAVEFVSYLVTAFAERGWAPLLRDPFNRGKSTSFLTGWDSGLERQARQEAMVDQWLALWMNQKGDLAWYALRYESPLSYRYQWGNRKGLDYLHVYAMFIPAEMIEVMKSVTY